MTATTRTSPPPHPAEDARRGTLRGPGDARATTGRLGRVTTASMLVGAVAAAVLSMVVVGGLPEHVVTGAALLGFSLGWALLAAASARLTTSPQRWAAVPALAFAVAGVGLLVVAPGDAALTRSGWVWPPLMAALAVWTARRARRALHTRARAWLVYPALALLAAASVGGGYQTVRVTADSARYPMPGTAYDVGAYDLHLDCTGRGAPTVVLENGLGSVSALWSRVTRAVGTSTRVCAYDRAGQGWSDAADRPHDAVEVATDLHALLRAANEPGPYVLAGHSSGGVYAMAYAARYPADVAGMVLLDAPSPYEATASSTATTVPAGAVGPLGVLPALARVGLGQLLPTSFWSALPDGEAGRYRAMVVTARSAATTVGELSRYPAAFRQAQGLTSLGDTPLVVVTTAATLRSGGERFAAQERFARLSTASSLRVVDASHSGLLDERSGAAHSARAVLDVVRAVRTGAPLAGR